MQHDIEQDTYEPADRWVLLSSMTILLVGVGGLYYVFTIALQYIDRVLIE